MSTQTVVRHSPEVAIANSQPRSWVKLVEQHVEALKFGSVAITVHEGRVVQIEVSTKVRF